MHRAAIGDLEQPLPLFVVERAMQGDGAVDLADAAFAGFAVAAVAGVDTLVAERDADPANGSCLRSAYIRSVSAGSS